MKETFEKVFIKSVSDLPKEYGKYFVGINKRIDTWVFNPNAKEIGLNGSDKDLWLNAVTWYLSPINQEEQGKEYSEQSLDMMQYVTNMLYAAYELRSKQVDKKEFDEWVECEIKNIDEFMKKDIQPTSGKPETKRWSYVCQKDIKPEDCPIFKVYLNCAQCKNLQKSVPPQEAEQPDHIAEIGKMVDQPRSAEEILKLHIDKESMDELSENIWPDMIEAMEQYKREVTVISEKVNCICANCGEDTGNNAAHLCPEDKTVKAYKFVVNHKTAIYQACRLYNGSYTKIKHNPQVQELIEQARKEIGYSEHTWSGDIFSRLRNLYAEICVDDSAE